MNTLSASFTIEVNGTPIAKVGPDAEDRTHATIGPDAAVFTLKDGRLQSGDWILGRPMREDRSLGPKAVRWFRARDGDHKLVNPVTAHEDGHSYKIEISAPGLMIQEDKVFVDLLGNDLADVVVKIF
ncbi:hypothetical protein P280DRAFT_469334 [Massarina eburnea CBS 473.64]|uniref:Uncharacterized protein n=1 Tax=Massarina eburnea CBS 473.64 TaxID=1395130 RepID=A0A6A6RZD2_9PLEO|nr:hypothetical protein P280DRAFT_469334 [Massarina eburnea CBS 473.64]